MMKLVSSFLVPSATTQQPLEDGNNDDIPVVLEDMSNNDGEEQEKETSPNIVEVPSKLTATLSGEGENASSSSSLDASVPLAMSKRRRQQLLQQLQQHLMGRTRRFWIITGIIAIVIVLIIIIVPSVLVGTKKQNDIAAVVTFPPAIFVDEPNVTLPPDLDIHPYTLVIAKKVGPFEHDGTSPLSLALDWVIDNIDDASQNNTEEEVIQAYALVASLYGMGYQHEILSNYCQSMVAICHNNTDTVKEIRLSGMGLEGTIGSTLGLLTSLQVLDAGSNALKGSIPEELYSLTNLTHLYLDANHLTGTLSDVGFSELMNLERAFLGSNELQGPLPSSTSLTTSDEEEPRSLRYLSLFNNSITGTLPDNLDWQNCFYLDLSFNQITGTIPESLSEWFELRHLYLDHNQLTGTVPESIPFAGNGRLYELTLHHNRLTGSFPDGWFDRWKSNRFMSTLKLEHNNFTEELGKDVCKMDVFSGGELTMLSADCSICACKSGCELCTP